MKKLFSIFLLAMFALQINAIPAKRVSQTVKLEDGTSLTVYLRGDETYHFLVTKDGIPVVKVTDDTYRIATELTDSIYANWTKCSKARNEARFAKARNVTAKNGLHKTFGYPTSYTGQKRGIVILINFNDTKMKTANTNAAFTNQFNQVGYYKNSHNGSVHDYFLDASYGKLDLEFDVFGPVTVSKNYSYYGSNDSSGNDKYPATMCIEAVKLANSANTINWKNYDWDNDGYVDQVYFIYAGYGEAAGGSEKTIWPHEWDFESAKESGDGSGPLTLGGVKINTYACSCELAGSSGSTMDGIGTACHEFSHCLGIPDFYDTSYSGGFGMNAWDLMDQGSYNGPSQNGEVPCGYSAYERWFAGWLNFTELNEPCFVKDMPALQDSALAYIIYNGSTKDEYFILENRQDKGFFEYTNIYSNCHGLLAYHVDYNVDAWVNDEVNNTSSHQRMAVIPAGKSYGQYYSDYGSYYPSEAQYKTQLFPGTNNITELTNTSHASYGGKLFNKNTDGTYYMNKPITNIAEANGLISFTFMGGIRLEAPQTNPTTDVGNGSFTANWNAVDGAESYTLELTPIVEGVGEVLSEDMSSFATYTSDGTSDISSNLDAYMQNSGWKGSKVYTAANSVKIGTSNSMGNITSPLCDVPNSGTVTVSFNAKYYNNDVSSMKVSLIDESGNEISYQTLSLASTAADYTVVFNDVTSAYKVKLSTPASKKRSYIYSITIFDGDASSSAKAHKASTKQTFTGIEDTSYAFTGLTEDSYKYRVKAVCGEASSEWSSYITVDLASSTTDIKSVSTDTTAEYFTLNGIRISRPTVSGIYLVKKGDKVQKMLIGR